METTDEKTIDMLTTTSVSIVTVTFFMFEGEKKELKNNRKAYVNTYANRAELQAKQPQNIVDAVLAMWGDCAESENENETKNKQ